MEYKAVCSGDFPAHIISHPFVLPGCDIKRSKETKHWKYDDVSDLLDRSGSISGVQFVDLWICSWYGFEYRYDRRYFSGRDVPVIGKLYVKEPSELYSGNQAAVDAEQCGTLESYSQAGRKTVDLRRHPVYRKYLFPELADPVCGDDRSCDYSDDLFLSPL